MEYKYQARSHFFSFAADRQLPYFPEAKLSSTFLPAIFWKYSKIFHQQPENIQRFFRLQKCLSRKSPAPENFQRLFACKIVWAANHQHSKIFKDVFACKIVLAANHQYPGTIQRFSGQQQPAKATSSSNQQQQSAAATRKRNQQQQPAASTSSRNQQQQPSAATSSSNQQQQSATVISIHPTSDTYTINDDLR